MPRRDINRRCRGRFTSVDPLGASATIADSQSFNRYSYVQNNPINGTDPTGMMLSDIGVYQTANPECAAILERAMVRLFEQAIRPPSVAAGGTSLSHTRFGKPVFQKRQDNGGPVPVYHHHSYLSVWR